MLPFPDLLEEAFIYLDHKKTNSNYRRALINKYKLLNKLDINGQGSVLGAGPGSSKSRLFNMNNNANSGNSGNNRNNANDSGNNSILNLNNSNRTDAPYSHKSITNPEYLFFHKLNHLIEKDDFNIIIKLLHLYNIVSIVKYNNLGSFKLFRVFKYDRTVL